GADVDAELEELVRDRDHGAFAQVVGAELKGQPVQPDLPDPHPLDPGDDVLDVPLVRLERRLELERRHVRPARQVQEGAQVLGQAGAAERAAGPEVGRGRVQLRVRAYELHQRAAVDAEPRAQGAHLVREHRLRGVPGVAHALEKLGRAVVDPADAVGTRNRSRINDWSAFDGPSCVPTMMNGGSANAAIARARGRTWGTPGPRGPRGAPTSRRDARSSAGMTICSIVPGGTVLLMSRVYGRPSCSTAAMSAAALATNRRPGDSSSAVGVPTQRSIASVLRTTSSIARGARSRPSLTAAASSSPRPGSTQGATPFPPSVA